MRITDVTEKPPLDEVKSEYAVVGRYLLDPGRVHCPRKHRTGCRR